MGRLVHLIVATQRFVYLYWRRRAPPLRKSGAGSSNPTRSTARRACRSTRKSTVFALRPVMGVFNNLVIYDQHVKQNSMQSIVPELAKSWSWDEDGTRLTFKLHEGVKWHDGKPFTANDVKCTWDLLHGKASEKLRINPRKSWYRNLEEVTTNGDYEATFHLKRPQPAFLALLASGFSPVYPCHVAAARHAAASDRHRPVQIRRVQAERVDQAGAQPRLLETGPALSRRHRVYDHPQHVDARSWLLSPASSTSPSAA